MYRFDWDGSALSLGWRAAYDSAEDVPSPIRLGPGSGSTPSLMGTKADDDRFVVITDGQALMNLVLFWRDEVPEGWEPIAPGKDPRIACEIPVDFDTGATEAISEQSVAVRGYSAIVVNDLLTDPTINPPSGPLDAVAQNTVSALEGGHSGQSAVRFRAHRLGSGNTNLFHNLGQVGHQRAKRNSQH